MCCPLPVSGLPTIRPEAYVRRSYIVSLVLVVSITAASLIGVLAAGWAPVLGVQLQGGVEVVLRPTEEVTEEQLDRAIEIIRSRVDALGVAEPDITRQGDQVVIQLPGVKDRQRAVELVGQTAELRFRPVQLAVNGNDPQARAQMADLYELFNDAAITDPAGTDPADDAVGDEEPPAGETLDTEPADDSADVPPDETAEPAPPTTTTVSPWTMAQFSAAFTAQLTGSAKAACSGRMPAGTLTAWPLRKARAGIVMNSAIPPGYRKLMGRRSRHRFVQPRTQ